MSMQNLHFNKQKDRSRHAYFAKKFVPYDVKTIRNVYSGGLRLQKLFNGNKFAVSTCFEASRVVHHEI